MEVPQQIGKYQVRRELGRGAMGIVYEAFDPAIAREVAIKVLNTGPVAGTGADELRSRFRREAQAAGRLSHAHIVAIYDYGDSFLHDDGKPGGPYIVMEMVRGQTLKDVLDRGVRPALADVVRRMGDLLAALHHAHERGVVHRDIKPANLILLGSGELKVADFGIARVDASDLTSTGAMLGTVSYMSPEQLLGQAVDRRTDIYACGVLLYLLLTSELPFLGTTASVMQRVLNQDALPPSKLNRTLSPAWDPLLLRALAKQPSARYATAADFARAIEGAARASDDEATVIQQQSSYGFDPAPPRRVSRGMAWRWATGGVAVLLVSAGSWRVLQGTAPAETQVVAAAPSPAPAPPPSPSPAAAPSPPAAVAQATPKVNIAASPATAPQASSPRPTALALTPARQPIEPRPQPDRSSAASAARPAAAPASKPKPSPAASPTAAPRPAPAPSAGPSVEGDFARTRRECEALRAPDLTCQRMLGLGYLHGRGGEKDVAKGLAWLGKSAEGGDAAAQYALALAYLNGTGTEKDDARAAQWMRRAAGQGHTVAMNDLGWMHEKGRGVSTDPAAAAEWYRKSAEAGFAQGQANYGRLLLEGTGVAKNTEKGRAMLFKAADQLRPDAFYLLGRMYEQGNGVPASRTQAAQWYRKAVARGSLRNSEWDAHARQFLAANP